MKKLVGIAVAMMMVGVLLTGCYSKSCDQPQPAPYKDGRG
jgi:hypothetical protein